MTQQSTAQKKPTRGKPAVIKDRVEHAKSQVVGVALSAYRQAVHHVGFPAIEIGKKLDALVEEVVKREALNSKNIKNEETDKREALKRKNGK